MNKVKWGIIGSGNIANAFAHSVKYCQDSELVSIFGRNEEAVKQFSTKFAIEPYTNLDTFFSSDQIKTLNWLVSLEEMKKQLNNSQLSLL